MSEDTPKPKSKSKPLPVPFPKAYLARVIDARFARGAALGVGRAAAAGLRDLARVIDAHIAVGAAISVRVAAAAGPGAHL